MNHRNIKVSFLRNCPVSVSAYSVSEGSYKQLHCGYIRLETDTIKATEPCLNTYHNFKKYIGHYSIRYDSNIV